MHSEDAVTHDPGRHDHVKFDSLRGRCVSRYTPTRPEGVYLIYTPPIEQSDWLECYNHGTISLVPWL